MTRVIIALSFVVVVALGACAGNPEQGSTTLTTPVYSEMLVEEQVPVEEQTVEQGKDIESDDGTGILPEPGDGLEHPKSPNTSMIVPPPRD